MEEPEVNVYWINDSGNGVKRLGYKAKSKKVFDLFYMVGEREKQKMNTSIFVQEPEGMVVT